MWCLYRGPLLVLIAASVAKEKIRKVQWCDLYGRVPGEGNRTTVVFQNLRSQFDKDFYRDMSCIMKSALFIQLSITILPESGAPCNDIVKFVKFDTKLTSPTAIMLMGTPLCDVQATSTALKGVKNLDRLSFWKINACINCTLSTIQYDTAEGISVRLVAMPAVSLTHLVPHADSVHALANELIGTPIGDRVTGLYVPITPPKDPSTLRFSPWERGGHIAALVTLIFMFFVMALFACCCAFTQSALIIEDYNHRDEMQLIWRLQENEQFNEANFPPDPDNLSMHSEATQASAEAESVCATDVPRSQLQAFLHCPHRLQNMTPSPRKPTVTAPL